MSMTPLSSTRSTVKKGFLALGISFLSGCEFANAPQSFIAPEGQVARLQSDLFMLSVWLLSAILVVVTALLVYALWRYRDRGDDKMPYQNPGDVRFEVVWTVIPVLIIIFLAVPTVRATYHLASLPAGADPVEVKVTGYQYWWKFEYPDLGIVTANELHIPANRHVNFKLTSADVIHSFWVPRLAGKIDVNPGQKTGLWWVADRPGVYYGQCAEYCGTSHANMRMRVIVHTEDDFNAWVDSMVAARQPAVAAATDNAIQESDILAQGRRLFTEGACAACHTLHDAGATGNIGPDLNNFGQRQTLAAGVYPNTEENLRRWIKDPPEMKPGVLMPRSTFSDDEIEAVSKYLLSLK